MEKLEVNHRYLIQGYGPPNEVRVLEISKKYVKLNYIIGNYIQWEKISNVAILEDITTCNNEGCSEQQCEQTKSVCQSDKMDYTDISPTYYVCNTTQCQNS